MSEQAKYQLAKELGFAHKVKDGDWGNITTREAGNLVKAAIAKAEEMMAQGQITPEDMAQQDEMMTRQNIRR